MRVRQYEAKQAHYVPKRAYYPRSLEQLLDTYAQQPEIVYDYEPAMPEDGSEMPDGATAQNNFQPIKWLYCSVCYEKVKSTETSAHVCPEEE